VPWCDVPWHDGFRQSTVDTEAAVLEDPDPMTVYAIAQLSIHDRAQYDRYVSRFMDVLAKYDGRLLAADDAPTVAEGTWPYDRYVMLEFPDRAEFERWGSSPEYIEIAKDRLEATTGCVLVVQGISA
jgi:uncharacterized protein (DUF1330 family)